MGIRTSALRVVGATAVLRVAQNEARAVAEDVLARRPFKVATVAQGNKERGSSGLLNKAVVSRLARPVNTMVLV